jgi:tripartite-type tricarboxylate transporter receptor subunit TctC
LFRSRASLEAAILVARQSGWEGGYGLPTRCAREQIDKDLARGYISRDAACDDCENDKGGACMKTCFFSLSGAVLLSMGLGHGMTALAQTEPDFYAGKTISLVIGSGEGGIFDLGGRLMARFLQKYIPGNPTIVPRNMPGASSVVAAQYVYNVAPRDGLTLAAMQPTIVLNKNLDPTLKYQPERLSWIGRVQPIAFVGIAWSASGVKTIADARERTVIVSAQGASGISAIVPWALNRLAGTHFRVITGYESESPAFIAMERGEVQGVGSAALSDVLEHQEWFADHRIAVLYSIALKRPAQVPDAPAIVELADNDTDREVLALLGSVTDIGQTLMAPPGIPADREAVLRKAFDALMNDPDFVNEAGKIGIIADPLGGDALSALVTSASEAPPEVLEKLRVVTSPQL